MGRVVLSSPVAPGVAGAQAEWYEQGVAQTTGQAITGATTLQVDDSGGTFSVDQGSAYAITLPTPVGNAGLSYRFHLTNPGAFAVTIAPAAGSFVGTILDDSVGVRVAPATGSTLTFASGAAALGDTIEVYSTGSLWLVEAVASGAGGITIA